MTHRQSAYEYIPSYYETFLPYIFHLDQEVEFFFFFFSLFLMGAWCVVHGAIQQSFPVVHLMPSGEHGTEIATQVRSRGKVPCI